MQTSRYCVQEAGFLISSCSAAKLPRTRRKHRERPPRPGIGREEANHCLEIARKGLGNPESLPPVHDECTGIAGLAAEPVPSTRLSLQVLNPLGSATAKGADDHVPPDPRSGKRAPNDAPRSAAPRFEDDQAAGHDSRGPNARTNRGLNYAIEHAEELDLDRASGHRFATFHVGSAVNPRG